MYNSHPPSDQGISFVTPIFNLADSESRPRSPRPLSPRSLAASSLPFDTPRPLSPRSLTAGSLLFDTPRPLSPRSLTAGSLPFDTPRPGSSGLFGPRLGMGAGGGGRLLTDLHPDRERDRAPSCVSAMSNMSQATWWTAVASVPEIESELDTVSPSPERRDTEATVVAPPQSGSRRSSLAKREKERERNEKENRRPSSTRTRRNSEKPCQQDPPLLCVRKSSTRRPPPPLARIDTANSKSRSARSASTATTATVRRGSAASTFMVGSSATSASTPPSSPSWSLDDMASSSGASKSARSQRRPRCASSGQHSFEAAPALPFTPPSEHAGPVHAAPAEVAVEAVVFEPHAATWRRIDRLRAEYARADRRRRGLWGWIRTRVLCGGAGGAGGSEFWEEGKSDAGSVRRYRLALPEDEGAEKGKGEGKGMRKVAVPLSVRSLKKGGARGGRGREEEGSGAAGGDEVGA